MKADGKRIEHGSCLSEQRGHERPVFHRPPPFPRMLYLESSELLDLRGVLMTAPKWLPGARMLMSYRISWLRRDVVAGIVLTTLLVPQ
ncbi:MAG: hypothetical protein ACXWPG_15305, partial [Ktedonobacteraceae bacterium]